MPSSVRITKVWIETGCTLCEACWTACPQVFAPQEDTACVRPETQNRDDLEPHTHRIIEAAEACPMGVIHYETAATESDGPAFTSESPESAEHVSRRSLIGTTGLGCLALGGGAVLGGFALQRFMIANTSDEPNPDLPAGSLKRYAGMTVGQVSEALIDHRVWIARLEKRIVALDATCTHLGCVTRWVREEGVFKCPCHGSSFSQTGEQIDGPAPRPLERLGIRVRDGVVMIDRNRRFRQERGQWSQPDSYVAL